MGEIAIRVERLGKRYRLGPAVDRGTAYDAIAAALLAPFQRAAGKEGSKRPETIWALRDVTFDLHRGEVLGVIGRNGAGKSTLLKILSRITEPTEGAVDLCGRVGSLLEVGTGFHPELTGRENIFLNGAILGMRRAEIACKFDEIVAFAEVEAFLDTPVKHYSSGMYLRLAFAVAAHLEPEILLVDEVLAVGDADFQKKCLGKMGEVATGGRTVLFVSHNMPAVRRLCTSACLLEKGRIAASGDAVSVVEAYYRSIQDADTKAPGLREAPEGTVRFVSWRVGDSPDESHRYVSGEACRFHLRLAARRPVRDANFGIALWANDGTLVWAMRSLDHGGECVRLQEGRYEVQFALPSLPLRPGSYQILVSVNDLGEGTLDAWYAQPLLQVEAKDESGLPPQWQGILDISGRFALRPLGEGGVAKEAS
jgi:lipopolysaccharide transport system ATP-binding protein